VATRIQQVAGLIRRQAGSRLCEDCIAEAIGITRQTVNTITNAFHEAKGEFSKFLSRCSNCGEDKLSTRSQ
jgi:hypothetical protein